LPEKIYESWCEVKELLAGKAKGKGKVFPSATPGEPPTAGDGKPSNARTPSGLNFDVKYF